MSYTNNPYAPKARMLARSEVVQKKRSVAEVARKYGVARTTIWRWVKRAALLNLHGKAYIDTLSSAPKHHPNQLKAEVVQRILTLRKQLKRCAPVIHAHLKIERVKVSLSSVERTLRRHKLTRRRKQTKAYIPIARPIPEAPGSLVQVDTIHFVRPNYTRCYVYAVIDLYSRLGYAEYHNSISHRISYQVILNAQKYLGFTFKTVQTDHGSEFSESLSYLLRRRNILLRHSRVRRPNDNAHVERFIRTIQEECFDRRSPREEIVHQQLSDYILYYNERRLHLALNCMTPIQYVAKVLK